MIFFNKKPKSQLLLISFNSKTVSYIEAFQMTRFIHESRTSYLWDLANSIAPHETMQNMVSHYGLPSLATGVSQNKITNYSQCPLVLNEPVH